jgi:transposase
MEREVRKFGTTTRELLAMSDWLTSEGVTHAAMEATGSYWKPVWNLLEGSFELLLVNPAQVRQVPGRKTDVKDSEWIGELLLYGLLAGSFVPAEPQLDLRDLTRHRTCLVQERARAVNRIEKILQEANLKLSTVATDILGKSGRAMLEAIIAGENDPKTLAKRAQGLLRKKIPQLEEALRGRVREHHRYMLKTLLGHVDFLDRQIVELTGRIEASVIPFQQERALMETIPGVKGRTAEKLLAEIGPDGLSDGRAPGLLGEDLSGQ